MKILKISLPVPIRRLFDYLPMEGQVVSQIQPGARIRVPFGRRKLVGILIKAEATSAIDPEKLKYIDEVLDETPILSAETLKFCRWAAEYYHFPLGEVLQSALPGLLRKGKKITAIKFKSLQKNNVMRSPHTLNQDQQHVVHSVLKGLNQFNIYTLHGVTGSGKTEVYLQIMEQIIADKQVLVLVPEINLTPQTLERFEARFHVPIVSLHSRVSEKERLHGWLAAKRGEAKIIIGTRSAIFASFHRLGLIVVDEEHDVSYKQHEGFRYNARDLAIWRAREENIPIILGSATPSLETLHKSMAGLYHYFTLKERAGLSQLPKFKIVDIRRQFLQEGLCDEALKDMQTHLEAGNQILIFLNRRGFAPVLICHACGWMAVCKNCDVRMTYHLKPMRLHCHHCDSQKPVPKLCEVCGESDLQTLGAGTQRLEQFLQKKFENMPLIRIDRDSTRGKGMMEDILKNILSQHYRILIGTQMLAKGHHFPEVTLVVIIDSDYGLFSQDFRASERLGQLLLQVSGRAGRDLKPGEILIQTHHPEHPLMQILEKGAYDEFAQRILKERKEANLPPFSSLALLHAEAHKLGEIETFLKEVKRIAHSITDKINIKGPASAIIARRAGRHRMQLLFQAPQKKGLQLFLRELVEKVESMTIKKKIHWYIDVDPLEVG